MSAGTAAQMEEQREMESKTLSPQQRQALHTLWGAYSRRFLTVAKENARSERLAWASRNVGRAVESFTELNVGEAAQLIELMKRALGQETKFVPRRRRDRHAAMAAGTHGRRGRKVNVEMIATREDLEQVDLLRQRLSMTPEQFQSWLASRSSPIGRHFNSTLRTVSDCNRVRWALKAMLKRAG
jgi:hypothetical protein